MIGIIGLLVSILLPSLARANAAARRTKCLSTLKQFGAANQMYITEFRGFVLPCRWGYSPNSPPNPPNPPAPAPASGPSRSWANVFFLSRFFGSRNPDNGMFPRGAICPDASFSYTWASASDVNGFYVTLSYGMNTEHLSQTTATDVPNTNRGFYGAPHYFTGWKRNQIISPSDKIQFVDAIGSVNSGGGAWPGGGTVPYTTRYFRPDGGEVYDPSTYPARSNIVAYRHNKAANVLFYDGHVESRHYDELRHDAADPTTARNKRQWQPQVR